MKFKGLGWRRAKTVNLWHFWAFNALKNYENVITDTHRIFQELLTPNPNRNQNLFVKKNIFFLEIYPEDAKVPEVEESPI